MGSKLGPWKTNEIDPNGKLLMTIGKKEMVLESLTDFGV